MPKKCGATITTYEAEYNAVELDKTEQGRGNDDHQIYGTETAGREALQLGKLCSIYPVTISHRNVTAAAKISC